MKLYRTLLIKAYFDKGYSLLSYPKYILFLGGGGSILATGGGSTNLIIILGLIFGFICIFLGAFWYKSGIILTENEISNQFNPFQCEVREKIIGITNNRKIYK
jgi:hypothetical protein